MPTWRVKTENAHDPSSRYNLAPASAPVYAPTPFSVHGGLIRLAAAPGTVTIPAPIPAGLNQRSENRTRSYQGGPFSDEMARGDLDLRSDDVTPNAWLPRLFVQFMDNLQPVGGTVMWASSNEIPIPAGNYVRLPQVASKTPPRIGGRGVIPAPRAFTRWPSITPSVVTDG